MSREGEVGTTVIDQFPAFEDDGFTKRVGLSSGDFTVTAFKDGVLQVGFLLTIVEISASGEYRISFTPVTTGFFNIQVLVNFSKDIWEGEFDIVPERTNELVESIRAQTDKIDLAPTLGPNSVINGSLMDRMMNKNAFKTYNQATDSLEALKDRMG